MQYRSHRYQTQFPVQITTAAGQQQCRVIDVNTHGARIAGLRNARRGDKLQIRALNERIPAVVCWATGDTVGIMFRPQISNRQVDTLRYRKDGSRNHQRGSVGFRFAEM